MITCPSQISQTDEGKLLIVAIGALAELDYKGWKDKTHEQIIAFLNTIADEMYNKRGDDKFDNTAEQMSDDKTT